MQDIEGLRPFLELTAVAAGAVSGALHARGHRFDVVGVEVIGIVSGLGGGMLRDVLLGQGPALALQSPAFLITALVAALLGSLFGSLAARLERPIWVFDALTLGLFTVTGLQRAEAAGLTPVPCLLLGVITGVGGGLVRDVLCRETPKLLLPGTPYAFASLVAGIVYLIALRGFGVLAAKAEWLAVAVAFGIRMMAARSGWMVPRPPDLPRRLRRRLHAGSHHAGSRSSTEGRRRGDSSGSTRH